ncbi:MAG: hydroxymethylbilane synthase [Pseudomonadota bacterium]
MTAQTIRLGTRGSPLALAQAYETRDRLMSAHGLSADAIEIKVIKTSGDRIQDRPLSEVGGKGLFTKEIEEALFSDEIDIAVHSMKDLETTLPDGLIIGAVLPRADVRDAFISLKYATLADIPDGETVGTSSLRRRAQLKHVRPDLSVVEFRGNVQTRLGKLEAGVAVATFLACAGLKRLGQEERITSPLSTDAMLPAVAQGAIALQVRNDQDRARDVVTPLNHAETSQCVSAERVYLSRLDGSCRTPIAGLAEPIVGGDTYRFRGQVLSPDGRKVLSVERSGPLAELAALAADAADETLRRGGREIAQGAD